MIATPGRLNDFLDKGKIKLNICKYIVRGDARGAIRMPPVSPSGC